ncbi:hypothetical protein RW25_29975 [Bacillus sp. L_1B0_8]|uniref:hypothetical protein n=1 Tax=unclassified Bacillus (in: firmicutes) TaxID=185979 RepID=UPI0005B6BAFF|nr:MULTISPECIES: hypothetical protein [unclassified Bacillus (in: firmicutes)]KIQ76777.1 hypothetical protein RT27_32075 [Bacillus sp. L_1B0_5]KIQ76962.1 hypothetical protein RW25_29975 [Bacillus sp. L_1B0_8]
MFTFTFEVEVPPVGGLIQLLDSSGLILFKKSLINGTEYTALHKESVSTTYEVSQIRYYYFDE